MDIYSLSRTVAQAEVRVIDEKGGTVRGSIRGPFCRFSRTLPTTHPIAAGHAIIVDPCYWTPSMPFRYEIALQIEGADGQTREQEFLWGIRWCVPHKQDLRLDAKRFVLRAVQAKYEEFDLAEFRQLSCALIVDSPSEETCEAASDLGVMIFDCSKKSANNPKDLNRYAAVHFAFAAATNKSDVLSVSEQAEADSRIIVMDEEAEIASVNRPVFVRRQIAAAQISDMRRACDSLQRDMAKRGQFAGYLITHK